MSYRDIVAEIKSFLESGDLERLVSATCRYSRRQKREIAYYYENSDLPGFDLADTGRTARGLAVSDSTRRNYLLGTTNSSEGQPDTGAIRRDLTLTESRMLELSAIVAAGNYSLALEASIAKCFRSPSGLLVSYWWSNPVDLKCRILMEALKSRDKSEHDIAICVFSCLAEIEFLKLSHAWNAKCGTDLTEQVRKWANPRRSGHGLVLSWLTYNRVMPPSPESDALDLQMALENTQKPDFDSIIRILGLRTPEQWPFVLEAYKKKTGRALEVTLKETALCTRDGIFFLLAHAALTNMRVFTCTALDHVIQKRTPVKHLALVAGALCDSSLTNDEVYTDELWNSLTRYQKPFAETLVTLWTAEP